MTPQKLEELQGLGGQVAVEIILNNGRRALGFVDRADNDDIVLSPGDNSSKDLTSVTYRTTQVSDFARLDQHESLNLDYRLPSPGTRIVIRLQDSSHICGYTMPGRVGNATISLGREMRDQEQVTRPHRHHRILITSTYTLKPDAERS